MSKESLLVLLVQAETGSRTDLEQELGRLGYRVQRCYSAIEAFCTFYQTLPDLVITDYNLPLMNGFQLCRCLKNDPLARYTPVVLLGSPEEHVEQYWSYKVGLDSFLNKDLPLPMLVQEISSLLQIYSKLRLQMNKRNVLPGNTLPVATASDSRERLLQLLDKALLETTIMREFREMAALAQQPELMNHLVFSVIESLIDYDIAVLFYNQNRLGQSNKVYFHSAQGVVYNEESLQQLQQHFALQLAKHWQFQNLEASTLERQVIAGSQPQLSLVMQQELQNSVSLSTQSVYVDRFEEGEQLLGAFALYSRKELDYNQLFPVSLIAQELFQLMKLHGLYYAKEMTALRDGVSDTFNFSYFMNQLAKECKRSQRYEQEFAVALIDIDHLKVFNEEHGYGVGDELIKAVAHQAQVVFRDSDLVARAEGASLAVLLTGTSLEQAQQACERLRNKMLRTPLMIKDHPLTCTISVGVTGYHYQTHLSSKQIYAQAFDALTQAKSNGRNRTCMILPTEQTF